MTKKALMPLAISLVLVAGIFLGSRLSQPFLHNRPFSLLRSGQFNKLNDIINYVQQEYVDTVNSNALLEDAISSMLHDLDPHSAYIPASELQAMNEPLEGNFEGIGIEFHVQNDTIMVVTPVSGGPSDILGIQSGDRIIYIEDTLVAGKGITNNDVISKLRGQGGTKVNIKIYRPGKKELIPYTITRGKIPIYSVDIGYMIDDKIGYIKISRFAATTYQEFMEKLRDLKGKGMQSLILDLRGNPGGYLNAATELADQFLDDKKLIVYTQGKSRPRTNYFSKREGLFQAGKLVVLIDEGSASASEILAGAVQDWDRATVMGRRSFGKGLVQEQTVFPDGSAVRLTIARYFTPTGRSIQKPYKDGFEAYNNEVYDRFENGEFGSADSILFLDSLKYTTPGGKVVYGGGGIMPDIFVPIDTTGNTPYLGELYRNGLISLFTYDYVDANRKTLQTYKNFEDFNRSFLVTDRVLNEFVSFAVAKGVKRDEAGIRISGSIIRTQLKAFIARQLFKNEGFYPVIHTLDPSFKRAVEHIREGS